MRTFDKQIQAPHRLFGAALAGVGIWSTKNEIKIHSRAILQEPDGDPDNDVWKFMPCQDEWPGAGHGPCARTGEEDGAGIRNFGTSSHPGWKPQGFQHRNRRSQPHRELTYSADPTPHSCS